jgi:hypothetical protein
MQAGRRAGRCGLGGLLALGGKERCWPRGYRRRTNPIFGLRRCAFLRWRCKLGISEAHFGSHRQDKTESQNLQDMFLHGIDLLVLSNPQTSQNEPKTDPAPLRMPSAPVYRLALHTAHIDLPVMMPS